jgi:hypothetical protein
MTNGAWLNENRVVGVIQGVSTIHVYRSSAFVITDSVGPRNDTFFFGRTGGGTNDWTGM